VDVLFQSSVDARDCARSEPALDINASVSNVSADLDKRWAGSLIVPLVDRGERDADVIGELYGAEQPQVIVMHAAILPSLNVSLRDLSPVTYSDRRRD